MKQMFKFGRNWKNYVKNVVNEKVIREAQESLIKFLPDEEFRGSKFIDIGCGSGLFSLSALLLGCQKVVSFDVDKESLEALEILVEKFEYLLPKDYRERWIWFQGDILDDHLVEKFYQSFDIVYSWGVLHHTGNMWKAIENASKLVKPEKYFIIGIYNHAASSDFWKKVKAFYNKYPIVQPFLGLLYASYVSIGYILRRRTLNLYRERGMHVFYDGIDWIGGYPYEYACFDEVKNFVENLGFKFVKAPTILPCGKGVKASFFGKLRAANTGVNEFLFQKNI